MFFFVLFTGRGTLIPQCTKVFGEAGNPVNIRGFPCNTHKNCHLLWSDFAVKVRESATKWAKTELSVLARASVCKIFVVAQLCYVMQILHCARKNIQVFYRIFALLIWNSGFEPMRRDNLG